MYRKSYRMFTLVLVFAVILGLAASLAPATAEASGMGGHPQYNRHMKMDTAKADFKPNQLPNPLYRDVGSRCQWWRYELRGGRYVRTYCPCRYGDQEVDYGINARQLWAEYVATAQK